jgi:hypothetical protein
MLPAFRVRPRTSVAARVQGLSKSNPHKGPFPMAVRLHRVRRTRNCGALPLFDWADDSTSRRPRPSLAVRHFQRRLGVSEGVASLYARLAGFPVEGD